MYLHKLLFLALFLPLCGLSAQSSVWKVSDGSNTLYLGGTCHVLRESDFPLPAEFEQAYAQADSLAFEVDPAVLQDPALVARIMAESVYQDGRTLKSVLSAEAYQALAEHCEKSNLPLEVLNKTKPGMIMMMVAMQELTKAGVTQEGVDIYFSKRAQAEGKAVASLETADFQINLITNLGEGIESEMVLYGLQDLDQASEFMDEIIRAWRHGEIDTLNRLFIQDMMAYPAIYDLLLKDRNLNWVPQIEAMLETQPTEFVLVGVGHMAGEDGLIALLEAKGYSVDQLQ